MNSQLNKSDIIKDAFEKLFNERTPEEQLASEARLISLNFLDVIEHKYKNEGLSRKELAKKVGTSPSYITQLFRGDKLINLPMLARLKQALNIEFEIKEKTSYDEQVKDYQTPVSDGKGVWVYKPFSAPNYDDSERVPASPESEKRVA
jgi:transcriptional regulator with XRE-family HTH domain